MVKIIVPNLWDGEMVNAGLNGEVKWNRMHLDRMYQSPWRRLSHATQGKDTEAVKRELIQDFLGYEECARKLIMRL